MLEFYEVRTKEAGRALAIQRVSADPRRDAGRHPRPVLTGVEVKSGETLAGDMARNLRTWQRHVAAGQPRVALVYGGVGGFERWGVPVVGWRELAAAG